MAVEIDRAGAERIARLARLDLSTDELDRIARELSAIVTYVVKIAEVDVSGVTETNSVVAFEGRQRADEPLPGFANEDVLSIAPDRAGRAIRVPRVLG